MILDNSEELILRKCIFRNAGHIATSTYTFVCILIKQQCMGDYDEIFRFTKGLLDIACYQESS